MHRFLTVKVKEMLLFSCYQIIIIIIVNGTAHIELTHIARANVPFWDPLKTSENFKASRETLKGTLAQYGLMYAQLFVAGK